MYKNFSYIFGLAALFMLAACDGGDKKPTEGNKESVAESQESGTETRKVQKIKKVSENEQENNKGTVEENQNEENWGIYADINRPIEDETPTSAQNNDVNINAQATNVEISKTEMISAENGATTSEKEKSKDTQSANQKESVNSEPAKEVVADSTNNANAEKNTKEETSKNEDNLKADTTDTVDSVNTVDIVDGTDHTDNVNIADNIPSDMKDGFVGEDNKASVDANKENTEHAEILSETPKVSTISDIPVISEEFSEDHAGEVEQISESIPNGNEKEKSEEKSIES